MNPSHVNEWLAVAVAAGVAASAAAAGIWKGVTMILEWWSTREAKQIDTMRMREAAIREEADTDCKEQTAQLVEQFTNEIKRVDSRLAACDAQHRERDKLFAELAVHVGAIGIAQKARSMSPPGAFPAVKVDPEPAE